MRGHRSFTHSLQGCLPSITIDHRPAAATTRFRGRPDGSPFEEAARTPCIPWSSWCSQRTSSPTCRSEPLKLPLLAHRAVSQDRPVRRALSETEPRILLGDFTFVQSHLPDLSQQRRQHPLEEVASPTRPSPPSFRAASLCRESGGWRLSEGSAHASPQSTRIPSSVGTKRLSGDIPPVQESGDYIGASRFGADPLSLHLLQDESPGYIASGRALKCSSTDTASTSTRSPCRRVGTTTDTASAARPPAASFIQPGTSILVSSTAELVFSDRDLDGACLTNRVLAEAREEAPHDEVEYLPLVEGERPPRGLARRIDRGMSRVRALPLCRMKAPREDDLIHKARNIPGFQLSLRGAPHNQSWAAFGFLSGDTRSWHRGRAFLQSATSCSARSRRV